MRLTIFPLTLLTTTTQATYIPNHQMCMAKSTGTAAYFAAVKTWT